MGLSIKYGTLQELGEMGVKESVTVVTEGLGQTSDI